MIPPVSPLQTSTSPASFKPLASTKSLLSQEHPTSSLASCLKTDPLSSLKKMILNLYRCLFSPTEKISLTEEQKISESIFSFKQIEDLLISKENQIRIHGLLEELATSSVAWLAFNGLRLTKLGRLLKQEVHPFRFLLEIYQNPISKKYLEEIYEDRHQLLSGRSQIWKDFSQNLAKNFQSCAIDIHHYAESFAQELELDFLLLKEFVHRKDWEGLLLFIVQSKL